MVSALLPLAIFLGAAASAALAFFSFWGTVHRGAIENFSGFSSTLRGVGMRVTSEDMVVKWVTASASLWIVTLLLLRPSLLVGLLLLPIAAVVAVLAYNGIVFWQLRARTEAFLNQFETVLRLIGSGLRSGLGLQQSLNLVVDEIADPARYEFARVLGQTTIGVSVYDALDDLAERVKASETLMMARVVRVNAQTGGDLARVLEQLANTIRERRRMRRKISSLTAEGRAGAMVLAAVPIFLGGFLIMTQPQMAHGLLHLHAGHIVLLIIAVLESCGIFTLSRILKVNV